MPNLTTRIELPTAPSNADWVHIVDVSDTNDDPLGSDKKVTFANFISNVLPLSAKGDILTNDVFKWNPRKDTFDYFGKGHVMDGIAEHRNWTDRELSKEFERRVEIANWMVEKGIKHYVDVGNIVAAYYKDPQKVIDMVKEEKIEDANKLSKTVL